MSREGQTLTRTMGFETRQHELFGIDLGEGAPRRMLVWGALCCIVWWGLLFLIFRSVSPNLFFFWLAPPIFLAVYGWRDGRTGRRRKITEWALTARWLARGHEPVIALGRHPAARSERMSLLDRLGHRFGHDDPLALVLVWRAAPERRHERPSPTARPGTPVVSVQTVQLVSTERAEQQWHALLEATTRRQTRRVGRGRRPQPEHRIDDALGTEGNTTTPPTAPAATGARAGDASWH